MFDPKVLQVLEESQRLGFLGDRDVTEVVEHARAFVDALDGLDGAVVDMGSGGGVPGLVIAHDRDDLEVVLIDRRSKRTDFLTRMVRRLGWTDRVTVKSADVNEVIAAGAGYDGAVARGFGPPETTLSMAIGLVRPGGRIIISEPPHGERWSEDLLAELGVSRLDDGRGAVSVFETTDP